MANLLTTGEAYDPFFYANAALRQLNKSLGMAFFVFRGFDRTPADRGSEIRLRRPGKFAAQTMPIPLASAEDILPDYQRIVLDNWFGSMFQLTDKELTFTRERIITEHVDPLAIAVADKIDQTLVTLQKDIGYRHQHVTATPVEDFPDIREILFDNLVPTTTRRLMVGGRLQNAYEKESVFYQADTGVDAALLQRDGFLGRKFGFDIFANQNVVGHTPGTAAQADNLGAINSGPGLAKGVTSLPVDGFTGTETVVIGDSITIGSFSYAASVGIAFVAGAGTLTIPEPGLREAVLDNAVVTLGPTTASTETGLAFHQEAFALAMAPLSSLGDGAGARIATVVDPITGITLRTTIFYDPGTAKNFVRIDALWGTATLNPQMAVNVDFD